MRFSIVTPSYNQVDYIEYTILSVLGQDYPDLEYIIVDGGSTDGSTEVIQKYSHQLAWWVSEPDNGQADAINKGLQRSTGEIVAWLNSDDMYAPGVLKDAYQVFETNPEVGMVYGNAVSFDGDGHPLNDLEINNWTLEDLVAFHIICQPAVFIRKSVLDQVGYLDEKYHMLLDHHLWLRVAQHAKIHFIPKVWAFARHHSEAKNVSQAPKFGREAFMILQWMNTQPKLALIIDENRHIVLSRIHRFTGRYLLDGGLPWLSLKAYIHSFIEKPNVALQEWSRIVFAILKILGLGKLGDVYYQYKKRQIPARIREMGLENIHNLYPEKNPNTNPPG